MARFAAQNVLRRSALPSIGTGVYGYPAERAAPIAVATVRAELVRAPTLERVVFCCFSDHDLAACERILTAISRA
jgi:O-acetyl-ADP-ribose deacetylase